MIAVPPLASTEIQRVHRFDRIRGAIKNDRLNVFHDRGIFGEHERSKKTELVILLRPVVVQNQQAWNRDVRDSRERIQGMRQPVNSNQQ